MHSIQVSESTARHTIVISSPRTHGLGFAGALREVGLPQHNLALPLLTFNLGVEVGQLLIVCVAYLLTRALRSSRWSTLARAPALYAIGITAAYWSWLRIAAIGS